jgi:hypothetical protein
MIDPQNRLVTSLPLGQLWNSEGEFQHARRLGFLGRQAIAQLLRDGPVLFVVADVGLPLGWIEPGDCYEYWKSEVRPHLAEPDAAIDLTAFPSGYAYIARSWTLGVPPPVVVLEKHH